MRGFVSSGSCSHERGPPRAKTVVDVTAEEKYVAAAYLAVFAFLLVYVLLIAVKLTRLNREVEELTRLARERKSRES